MPLGLGKSGNIQDHLGGLECIPMAWTTVVAVGVERHV